MRLKKMHLNLFLLLLINGLFASSVMAGSTDTQLPIHIEADRAEIDEARGVMTYTGSVQLRQGGIEVSADTLVVYSEEGDLQRITAQGKPVRYLQKAQLDPQLGAIKKEVRGVSQRLEYSTDNKQVVLLGKAEFWQAGNRFSGNRIQYNPEAERVVANAGGDVNAEGKRPRVTVILQPKNKKAKAQP